MVHMFKNWKLLFKNICGNTCGWKSALKCVKCCLKTKNGCLKSLTKLKITFFFLIFNTYIKLRVNQTLLAIRSMNLFFMYNFKLKNLKFKHLIDDITINFLFFWNFASMDNIICQNSHPIKRYWVELYP